MVDSVFLLIPSLLLLVVGISLLTRGRCQQGDGRPRRSMRRRQRQPPVLKPGGKRCYRAIGLDDMVHESILRPHGGLPHKGGQLSHPFSFSMAPPPVHCMAKVAAGQAPGQVAMPRKDDRGISGREDKLLSSINTSERVEKTHGLSRKNEQPQGLTHLKLSITELKCHGEGNRTEELCSNMSSSSQPPQTDCIVRESILRPDGRLPDRNGLLLQPPVLPGAEPALSSPENTIRKSFFQKHEGQASREKEFPQPHGLSMASSAVPGMAKVAVGPTAGPPPVVRNAEHDMTVKKHKLESSTDTDRSMGNPSGCSIQKQYPKGLRPRKISKMEILDSKEEKRNQDPHSGVSPSSQPPEMDCIVQESILHPDGGLRQKNGEFLQAMPPLAFPSLTNREKGLSLPQRERRDGGSAPGRDTDCALSHKECTGKLDGLPREQQQPRTGTQGSTGCNNSVPSARGIIAQERLLDPQDGRRQWEEVSMGRCLQDDQLPLKLSTAVPVLPSLAKTIMYKDQGCQTDYVIILDPFVNDIRNGKEPPTAAPLRITKLQLKEELHSKLREHITKKCREVQLQRFPGPVQRSMEMKHQALSKNPHTVAATLPPQSPLVRFSKPKTLVYPDQMKQKKRGASIACPEVSRTPRSHPMPVYFYSLESTFMPEEQREALELHIRAKKLQILERRLGMKRPSQSAVPQEEGGRAALRTSALPSTPCKPTKKSNTSRNHGSQQPDSTEAVRKGKRKNVRKLYSGLKGKAHGHKYQARKGVTGDRGQAAHSSSSNKSSS
ncbi:uncharacterized protein [Anas platyrhynchos]|uniref:uncharacterized protein n=1 Tax=Anas platyrhynchos TaxID=8839 RepID=UPI000F7C10AC|eukprot:XP_027302949.1 uncharacterized protein LOC113840406 [Anas platyrhynchos]